MNEHKDTDINDIDRAQRKRDNGLYGRACMIDDEGDFNLALQTVAGRQYLIDKLTVRHSARYGHESAAAHEARRSAARKMRSEVAERRVHEAERHRVDAARAEHQRAERQHAEQERQRAEQEWRERERAEAAARRARGEVTVSAIVRRVRRRRELVLGWGGIRPEGPNVVRNIAELEDVARECGALREHEWVAGADVVRRRWAAVKDLGATSRSRDALVYSKRAVAAILGVQIVRVDELLQPVADVVNMHYQSGPRIGLYDPVEILALRFRLARTSGGGSA